MFSSPSSLFKNFFGAYRAPLSQRAAHKFTDYRVLLTGYKSLDERVRQFQSQIAKLNEEKKLAKERIALLTDALDKEPQRFQQKLSSQKKLSHESIRRLQDQIQNLQQQCQESAAAKKQIEGQLANLTIAHSEKEHQLQNQIQNLQQQCQESTAAKKKIEGQLADLTKSYSEKTRQLHNQLQGLQRKGQESTVAKKQIENQLADLTRTHSEMVQQYQNQIQDLQQKCQDSTSAVKQLEIQLADLKKAHAEISLQLEQQIASKNHSEKKYKFLITAFATAAFAAVCCFCQACTMNPRQTPDVQQKVDESQQTQPEEFRFEDQGNVSLSDAKESCDQSKTFASPNFFAPHWRPISPPIWLFTSGENTGLRTASNPDKGVQTDHGNVADAFTGFDAPSVLHQAVQADPPPLSQTTVATSPVLFDADSQESANSSITGGSEFQTRPPLAAPKQKQKKLWQCFSHGSVDTRRKLNVDLANARNELKQIQAKEYSDSTARAHLSILEKVCGLERQKRRSLQTQLSVFENTRLDQQRQITKLISEKQNLQKRLDDATKKNPWH